MRKILPVVLLLAMSPAVLAQPADADEDAIQRVNERFMNAFAAGDADAVVSLYTDDAQFIAPGMAPLEGHGAIHQFLSGAIGSGVDRLELETSEIEVVGDTAYEVGTYEMSAGEQTADRGNYMVIWRRGADGEWRLHRDMINSTMPSDGN